MEQLRYKKMVTHCFWIILILLCANSIPAHAQEGEGPPPVPVRVTPAIQETVSDQITLIGSTEPDARSVVAAEVSGLVEAFPAREGDFVEKGKMLAQLRSRDLKLRLDSAEAGREKVRANLSFAEKELGRHAKLKDSNSIAAAKYDEVFYEHKSLRQQLLQSEAEIAILEDDIHKKTVLAPFSGFVAKEHTQVGEWLPVGGAVVTLVDLAHIEITVDVPERYAVHLQPQSDVLVVVGSVTNEPFPGRISAILPEGDLNARTFPVRVRLANPGLKIRSAMEARVTFNLGTTKDALLVPKDAVVTAGATRMVYIIADKIAQPANVQVLGYYGSNVAIEGPVKAGDQVVIRGNERLFPGQRVKIISD